MRKEYPSDVSREEFERIRPLLESIRKNTHPRTHDLYDLFNGVLYTLKTGCQWKALPHDFPNHKTVHSYFMKWSEERRMGKKKQPSVLEQNLKKIRWRGSYVQWTERENKYGHVLAQSVKNTDTAREKGYDAGKKVSGIKRHIAVDTNGLPHAIEVTTAEVTDREGAIVMTQRHKKDLSDVEKMLVDGAYSGDNFAQAIKRAVGATVEVVKRNELHTFVVIPQRWVVERSFAWLEKCRRLWKNCEKKLSTSRQMIILAFVSLLMRRG